MSAQPEAEQAEPAEPAEPDRPARWGRPDVLLASGIGLRALYGLAMLPLIPLLIGPEPLLLTLLSGSTVGEVVLGARVRLGEISWPVAIAAGVPLYVLTDWLYWAAGRRWGERALVLVTRRGDPVRARRRVDRAEAVMQRFGPFGVVVAKVLPVPSQMVYAAAGTGGMRLVTFVVLDAIGTVAVAAGVVGLGFAFGGRAVAVVELVEQYAVLAAVGLVVVLVIVLLVRRGWARRRRRRRPAPAARALDPQ